eukprot:78726-Chlamydomonas_euryale.AAC.1
MRAPRPCAPPATSLPLVAQVCGSPSGGNATVRQRIAGCRAAGGAAASPLRHAHVAAAAGAHASTLHVPDSIPNGRRSLMP